MKRLMVSALAGVVLAVCVAGCSAASRPVPNTLRKPPTGHAGTAWLMFQHDAKHTGRSGYVGPALPRQKWIFRGTRLVGGSPSVGRDGTIYYGSTDGWVYALNPDGTKKWTFRVGEPVWTAPAIASDACVFCAIHERVRHRTWLMTYCYDGEAHPHAGNCKGEQAAASVFGITTTDCGDVWALTPTNRATFAVYRCDAWGLPLSIASASVSDAPVADITARRPSYYAGYVYDPEDGLYYLSARTCDPATMQRYLAKVDGRRAREASAGHPSANASM